MLDAMIIAYKEKVFNLSFSRIYSPKENNNGKETMKILIIRTSFIPERYIPVVNRTNKGSGVALCHFPSMEL